MVNKRGNIGDLEKTLEESSFKRLWNNREQAFKNLNNRQTPPMLPPGGHLNRSENAYATPSARDRRPVPDELASVDDNGTYVCTNSIHLLV